MDTVSDWERLGGEEGVGRLVDAFLDRVFDDFIIGFFFEGRDHARIRHLEKAHARVHLGGPGGYPGRSLAGAHRPLRINRGHFRRRLAILRTVLQEHGVPEAVIDRWIAHDRRLEPAITDGTDCLADPGAEH